MNNINMHLLSKFYLNFNMTKEVLNNTQELFFYIIKTHFQTQVKIS